MKKLLSATMLAFLLSLLVGCGGGSDTSGGSTGAPSSPTTDPSSSNSLIIDNGRGTINNQDTESPQN